MTTLEENIAALEQTLSASMDDTKDNQHKMRMAIVQQAAEDMTDEEKKEARIAMGGDNHDELKKEMKKAMSTDDDDERRMAMKRAMSMLDDKDKHAADDDDDEKDAAMDDDEDEKEKKAMDDEDEKDKKIASLTASVTMLMAKPIVEKMLKARAERGMSPKDLRKFQKSLYGKSLTEIKARNAEDEVLYKKVKPLIAAEPTNDIIPNFNGNVQNIITPLNASESDEPLEALYS